MLMFVSYSGETVDEIDFCCPRMEEAYREEAVGFTEGNIVIYKRGVFKRYPIDCCPFCGTLIRIMDKEYYSQLRKRKHPTNNNGLYVDG